ncbi:MAG: cytidylate kinase-like family protein [Chloroflexota bacterium]
MPVITLSRKVGSLGDALAWRLAEELNLAILDKTTIATVAVSLGVSARDVVDYGSEQFRSRSFLEALFRRSRSVTHLAEAPQPYQEPDEARRAKELDEDWALGLVRAAVTAAHNRGDTLIIGRDGQAILADLPEVTHLRVVAPHDLRITRIVEERRLTRWQAEETVAEHDRASAEYLQSFYQAHIDDPALYHLVLNTGRLSLEQCVRLALRCAEREPA